MIIWPDAADEVPLCSATKEILPVTPIYGAPVGNAQARGVLAAQAS